MVERGHGVEQKKEPVGYGAFARMPVRDLLEDTYGVVGQKSDGSACKRRQIRIRNEGLARD
jgi:hypothetical protein